MIPMGERVRQAGDGAVPMLVDIQIHAAAEAFQALAALGENEFAGPNIAEAKRRIGNTIRLLLMGER
jgi:hypothetical protein